MKYFFTITFIFFIIQLASAQTDTTASGDTLSKFDRFNKKAEHLFKYLPVPLYSYSQEAGNLFGVAKFNLVNLYKDDTITRPSKFSGVFSASSKGRINFSLSTELVMKNNKYIFLSYVNFKKTPEIVLGIGNDVKRSDAEDISNNRVRYNIVALRKVSKYLYAGGGFDISYYYNMKVDSNSIMIREKALGLNGGLNVGLGLSGAYDSRDNRYNTFKGSYIIFTSVFYGPAIGSEYNFSKANLDARKFFNPWLKHVIALQATTNYSSGDVPYYNLALLGGESQMRGYYQGAIRDKVLIDAQVEYRMPIWNIFGVAAWVGTGRVAPSYEQMALRDLWVSYGAGLRIKVDSEHNTNLRLDMGFGPNDIKAFNIGFAEAF